jgi:hypothetical protein
MLELEQTLASRSADADPEGGDSTYAERAFRTRLGFDESRRRLNLAGARINAEQIDAGLAACLDARQQSTADPAGSAAAERLSAACEALRRLREERTRCSTPRRTGWSTLTATRSPIGPRPAPRTRRAKWRIAHSWPATLTNCCRASRRSCKTSSRQ